MHYRSASKINNALSVFQRFQGKSSKKKNTQDQIICQDKNPGSQKERKRYFADNCINSCRKLYLFFKKDKRKNCKI